MILKNNFLLFTVVILGLSGCVSTRHAPAKDPNVLLDKVIEEEKDPRRVASLKMVDLGRKEIQNLRYERAAQEFTKAIEVDAENPYAYYFFAEARSKVQRFEEAIQLYDQAANFFSKDAYWKSQSLTLKGEIHEHLQNYPLAKKSYEAALKIYSNNSRAKQGTLRLKKD